MPDDTDMFDPLPEGDGHCAQPNAEEPNVEWQAICPVPDDAPKPDFRHPRLGLPVAHWTYRDAEGRVLGHVARFEPGEGQKQILPLTFCRGSSDEQQWRFKGFPDPRPLYNLDQLAARSHAPVLVTEGEKAADRAAELFPSFVVTTSMGGAKSATKSDWNCLTNRAVFIWPDNDAEGRNYAYNVVACCTNATAVQIYVVAALDDFPDKWDLADPPPNDWTTDRLRLLLRAAKPRFFTPQGVIQTLNERHAVVSIGGKCAVLNEEWDPTFDRKNITFSSRADFTNLYANQLIEVGDKTYTWGKFWWMHSDRRQYHGVVFEPQRPTPGYYNLWTGFAVEPRPGNCSLYLEHIHFVIAGGDDEVYEYIIAWMADAVQRPTRRPGTSIVMRGKQGTGKGVCCTEFGKLFGQHFVHVQHARHLTGHFNAHLKDALVVFADEAFWAGDKSAEGALKAMVTEEQLPIEFKGKDVIYVRNHIRLMISSNHDWVVPAGLEERRFLVVDVSEGRMQDREYFAAIVEQMNNDGREALLDHLLNHDLTGLELRQFPQTDALREQKIHSMDAVEKWWLDCLMEGEIVPDRREWEKPVPCALVQEAFVQHAQRVGYARRSSETELGTKLKQLAPGLRKRRGSVGGRRLNVYEFPALDVCRAEFDRQTRTQYPWPGEED